MAELTFIGAAGTVTGSKHLLTSGGRHVLVDCGLFQGTHSVAALNSVPLPVAPEQIDAVAITHGHIDHVGYLPKLIHDGFRGPVYCTPPTRALMNIVLEDALHLQQHLYERGLHEEQYAPPPFYNQADVQRALQLTTPVDLATPFEAAGLRVTYHNAAHIIGSAFAVFEISGRKVVFSGDMGRYGRTLLADPDPIGPADALICESTYGDRVHPPDALADLGEKLSAGIARGGAIVIPAFAVERSQEILLSIGELQQRDSRFSRVPIYLDSPMAAQVDRLFEQFPQAHKPIPNDSRRTPFGCSNLTVAVSTDESKALNHVRGPHVIISASGMASGGRVLHHLYNHVTDPQATILFVGYQSAGTIGNALIRGASTVKLYGDILPVHAAIEQIAGFSAHADRNEMQRWLDTCTGKPHFFAVHGDPAAAQALCDIVRARYNWIADVAARGTTVSV